MPVAKGPVQPQKNATLPPPAEGPSVGAATTGTQETQQSLTANQAPSTPTLRYTGNGLCLMVPVIQNGALIKNAALLLDPKSSAVLNTPATGPSMACFVLQNNTLIQSGLQSNQITSWQELDSADKGSPPMLSLLTNQRRPSHPGVRNHILLQQSPQQPTAPGGGIPKQQSSSVNITTSESPLQGQVTLQSLSHHIPIPKQSNVPSEHACPQASAATDESSVPSSQVKQAIITCLFAQQQKRQALTQPTASLQTPVLSALLSTETPKSCQMSLKENQSSRGQSLYDGDSKSVSKDNLKFISHSLKQQQLATRTSHSTTTGGYISSEPIPNSIIHHHPASYGSDNHGPQSLESSGRQNTLPCPGPANTVLQSSRLSRSSPYDTSSPGLISTQSDPPQTQQLQVLLQPQELHFQFSVGTEEQTLPGAQTGAPKPDKWPAMDKGTRSVSTPEVTTPSRPANPQEPTRSRWPPSQTHSDNCPELPSTTITQQPGTSSQPNHHGSNHLSYHQVPRQSSDRQESSLISDRESAQLAGYHNEHKLSHKEPSLPSCGSLPNEKLDQNKLIEASNLSNLHPFRQPGGIFFPEHHQESDQDSSSTDSVTEEVMATTCKKLSKNAPRMYLPIRECSKRLSKKLKLYRYYIPEITEIVKIHYDNAKKTFFSHAMKMHMGPTMSSTTWSYLRKISKAHSASLNMLETTLDFELFQHRLLDDETDISPQTDDEIMDMLDMC